MESRRVYRTIVGIVVLPLLLVAGCPLSSDSVDLSARGNLTLVVSRTSESAIATATAQVADNSILSLTHRKITLADDQILSVNDVPLAATTLTDLGLDATVSATIEAVEAPYKYTLSFDNQGVTTTFKVAPPDDFSDVTPAASTVVSRSGFDLTWEPVDDDATVSITIAGQVVSYASDGSARVGAGTVSLADLADDGGISIGSAQLSGFVAGDITVTLTRAKTASQKLGFSAGTIRLEIVRTIPLTLTVSTVQTTTDGN